MTSFTRDIAADWGGQRNLSYYAKAEDPAYMEVFWGAASPFARLFAQMDPAHVVDLACGRGRHGENVLKFCGDRCRGLTLVDVNQSNIDACRDRFAGQDKASFLVNDGATLGKLAETSQTAVICYDAMVHFELFDVLSYLRDIHRVLVPGGHALLHHSNYDAAPGAIYRDNPGWRNFMSAKLFAHAAARTGFRVVEQVVLDWDQPQLDCLSLIEKPGDSAPATGR